MSLRRAKREPLPETSGRSVAVWSAQGSTGRSQVAAALAVELASLGYRTLLVDADVYSPSQLQHFGFGENHIGIASACRLISRDEMTIESLEALLLDYEMPKSKLSILPGLHLVSRWPELGFEPTVELIDFACKHFDWVVLDVSSSLERDLIDQRTLAERNAVTIATLSRVEHIVGLCHADPIGLARYVWAIQEVKQLGHGAKVKTLLNRVPDSGRAGGEAETALHRLAGLQVHGRLPTDEVLFARASELAVPINLVPRNSSVKQALSTFIRSQLLPP